MLFYVPLGLFIALILANFLSYYLSAKEIAIFIALFVVSFFLPRPFSQVLVVILDLVLIFKFQAEHF
jgi:chromate transport protein ChrA